MEDYGEQALTELNVRETLTHYDTPIRGYFPDFIKMGAKK